MRFLLMLVLTVALPAQLADKFVPAEPENARYFGGMGAALRANLQQLLKADQEVLLAPFEKRPWADARAGEAVGRFLFTASEMYRYQKEQKLRVLMERVVKRLLAAQETDGYLGTEVRAGRWKQWDVSVHKEVINGLIAYARTLGDERALAGARRAGELLVATFGPDKRDILASSAHEGWAGTALLAAFCDLHRYTQDARFLAFAEYLVAAWEQPKGPQTISTLLAGSVRLWPAEHAGVIVENLVGLLELYRWKNDERFLLGVMWAQEEMAGQKPFTESPWWVELNWQLLRLTGQAVYARELAAAVRNGFQDARLVALSPQFVAGAYAGGVALVQVPEGTFTVVAAGRSVRLEAAGRKVTWIEGEGRYPLWLLARPVRPLYIQRKWTIGGVYELPE